MHGRATICVPMSKRNACVLMVLGAVAAALAGLDFALARERASEFERAVIRQIDDYRQGRSDVPPEYAVQDAAQKERRAATVRLQLTAFLGILLVVLGAVFLVARRRGPPARA
jgi:hypothetical protein